MRTVATPNPTGPLGGPRVRAKSSSRSIRASSGKSQRQTPASADRRDAAGDDGGHRAEQRRGDAGLERAELVRGADEHHLDRDARGRAARSASRRATVVLRMFMLIMSTKPLTASATSESGSELREAEDDHATPEQRRRRRAASGPRAAASGRRVSTRPASERADGRRAAQHAEARRARVEDRAREERQQRHGAAEEDGEEVERDRAEQHRRAADEADAGEHACARLGRLAVRSTRGSWTQRAPRPAPTASRRAADAVDELGLIAKRMPPSAGPATIADLERDRAERHRAREQLARHEHRRRARGRPAMPIALRDAGRRGEHEERPELVAPARLTTSSATATTARAPTAAARIEPARDAVGELPGRAARAASSGTNSRQADQPEVERPMRRIA